MAHIAIAGGVTVHVLLNKRNIGTSISWMGIAWLSPFIGGLLYYAFGVNRVKRRALRLRRKRTHMFLVDEVAPDAPDAGPLTPLEYAIGRLTGLSAEPGNRIEHDAQRRRRLSRRCWRRSMRRRRVSACAATSSATTRRGMPFIEALIRAHRRGVAGAGADRRRRRRLFLVGHLPCACARPACRSTVSCIPTCRGRRRSSTCATIAS